MLGDSLNNVAQHKIQYRSEFRIEEITMSETKETTEESSQGNPPEEISQNSQPEEKPRDLVSAAQDAWEIAEYSMHDSPNYDDEDGEEIIDPLQIDKLLDESRTTIWAKRGTARIKFVVRKLTSTEMAIFLKTLFGISAFLDQSEELSDDDRLQRVAEELQDLGPTTLYDKILMATEAAIESPEGVTHEMLHNWPEELVNKLTHAATGGAFGDTAQIRFLKRLDESGLLLTGTDSGSDSAEVSDTADGDSEDV